MERRRLSQPLLYLSAYFEATRREYYQALQRVRTEGDWEGWVRYFLSGVVQVANEAVGRAGRLMDLRERFRRKLLDKPRALRLLDELFVNPYMTAGRAEHILGATAPTARLALRHLQDVGLLQQAGTGRWRRVYLARPIQRMIE